MVLEAYHDDDDFFAIVIASAKIYVIDGTTESAACYKRDTDIYIEVS